ncbi:MAG: DUF4190 domain-containing protein [Anaerohalosphaeraceae bacterium]|nr:DUF4190 domain-containing protein [Anaerohalosphaeraceae bacterium]
MYCQKCGTENLGDAQVCAGCGGVFVYSETARTSGMAITSMILGISGFSMFGVFGVTWIIGLIFGIIALQKISKSGGRLKGKGWAITGIVTSGAGLALVLTIFGIWMIFTSVKTVSLREQVGEMRNTVFEPVPVVEAVVGIPSIEGVVSIADSRGTGSNCSKVLFDAEVLAENSLPVVSNLACGPGDKIPTDVTWSFIGVKGSTDVYDFTITPGNVIAGVGAVIKKTISYDGSEQVVYENDTVKVIITSAGKKTIE